MSDETVSDEIESQPPTIVKRNGKWTLPGGWEWGEKVSQSAGMTPKVPNDEKPTLERIEELRAAHENNIKQDRAPYARVHIATRGELLWVMEEREWSGELEVIGYDRPDLREADLSSANLQSVHLIGANLSDADLMDTDLSDAWLFGADLSNASLDLTDLSNAELPGANFSHAWMQGVDLRGATLGGASFQAADLRYVRMNVDTVLVDIKLDSHTKLGDIVWNSVGLTRIDWKQIGNLGDDPPRWERRSRGEIEGWEDRWAYEERWLEECESGVRANRQLSTVLREQGLNEFADHFAYRTQLLQRQAFRRQGRRLHYLSSVFLDLIAGYGYKPLRSFTTYLIVVIGFSIGYYLLRNNVSPALSVLDSIVFSITSFHGRGFMPGESVTLHNPLTLLAAVEAIVGLLIEITFIATFTQRFFAR